MTDRRNGMSLREAIRRNARAQQQQQNMDVDVFAPRGNNGASASAGPLAMARAYRVARQSGQLNISSRGLTAFPKEILRLFELVEEDEKSWECVPLVKVDLSYNEIASLPDEIQQLPELTSFKMRHNSLHTLPSGFFELSALTALDLSNNQLAGALPDAFGKLVALRDLGLERNKISSLPEAICQLPYLEVLRVDENALESLPNNFASETQHVDAKLEEIDMRIKSLEAQLDDFAISQAKSHNSIPSISDEIGALTTLTSLKLCQNKLVELPEALFELTALTYLDLSHNQLQGSLSERLGNLVNLKELSLGTNRIQQLPESLGQLSNLEVLRLEENKMEKLPQSIGNLRRLNTLVAHTNSLATLPSAFSSLRCLQMLDLKKNFLEALADQLATLQSLKFLDLRQNKLTGFPQLPERATLDQVFLGFNALSLIDETSILRAKDSITVLELRDNKLSTLPVNMGSPYCFETTLIHLNLSKNHLTSLPSAIGRLAALQLQLLRIRKNQLTSAAVEEFLGTPPGDAVICSSLKELDLRNNLLAEMPTSISALPKLETLLLSFNKLETLDGFLWHKLSKVSVISVSDNKLRSLGQIYLVPMLASLSFENNNLTSVPSMQERRNAQCHVTSWKRR
ncbi:hypothetical protein P43SY_007936 [Pythium insidiosum]|uniref:Disease resistance R13L4/SHOC-2-like LRR domain-containing protein n=1 Tax=Pythium insidiosum TaxID=114742 RepID=A0AAD5QCT8_PYTIN|nr:hypothetical protein P43SY_007936 [Pythium insidiosum]